MRRNEGVTRARSWRRSAPMIVGLIVTMTVVFTAVAAHFIMPFDPDVQDLPARLTAPGVDGHILGTDQYGRDVLSRVIIGTRISLIAGVGASLVGALGGSAMGMIAGYGGRWMDLVIGRVLDVILAFPAILLALALVASLGPSLKNIIVAIGVTSMPTYGRVVRASVLSVKHRDFVTASEAVGASKTYVVMRHIFPNIVSPIIVTATVGVATAILVEATLSFLGLGTPPPTATWGTLINDGKEYLDVAPWIASIGGIAILIAVFGLTLLGDGLRDRLDPKLRH